MIKRKEQFKKLIRSLFTILLLFCTTVVFADTWITEYNPNIMISFFKTGNWFFYAVYVLFFSFFLYSFDGLKYGVYQKFNIIIGQTLAAIATAFVVYLQIVLLSAEFVTVIPLLRMVAIDFIIIFLITVFSSYLLSKLFPARKTLIIYDEYSPSAFIAKLSGRKDKFAVKNVINISVGLVKLEEYIKNSECVIIYDVHSENRNKILKYCFENDVRAYTTTKISDILMRGAEGLHLFDTPLLLYRNMGLTFPQRFFKRLMDIAVSLIMLIITSPFLLISAIAIKAYDGGPIFFRQARCTIGGKIFYIHKFRSMIVDAEKDGISVPASEKDPRITPVGKILRATRLDELPQLIDILIGNMSLVGPRPERIEHVEKYTNDISEFSYRLKVKGGLTGYAQLYGKYNTTPYDKLQLDLMYIENYSLLLDIRLILMTVKIMFMKESTEGFDEEQRKSVQKNNKTKPKK